MSYVLDASVALRWFIKEERHEHAGVVLENAVRVPERFAVPELFTFEVFAVLFRVHPEPLRTLIEGVLPILNSGFLRYPMTDTLAERASRIVSKGLTGYDATYAALAEELGGLWLTFDTEAHNKLRGEALSLNLHQSLPNEWE